MTTRTYSGLCIGGPYAGKWLEHEYSFAVLPVQRNYLSVEQSAFDSNDVAFPVNFAFYRYEEFSFPDKNGVRICSAWLDAEREPTLDEIIPELLKHYTP